MIGRVTTCQTTLDKLDEVIKSFKEGDIPAAKLQKGFRGCYLLTDRKTGKFISISFWDSKNDVIADEGSGQYQKRVDLRKNLYTSPPVRELYEVSAQD
jgi:heme-degrading monooxygenase HmoA